MGSIVNSYVWVIKIALALGIIGILKDATLSMAGRAAMAQQGMISYSKFTKILTAPAENQKTQAR